MVLYHGAMMTKEEYRDIRLQLGLTQEGLAQALGVSLSTVQRRESGATIDREAALAITHLFTQGGKL